MAHKSRHNDQPNSNEHSPRPLEPKFQISNFKTKMGDTGWGHQQNLPFRKTTKSEHLTDTEKFRRYFLKCARILDFVVFIETKKYFLKWTIHLPSTWKEASLVVSVHSYVLWYHEYPYVQYNDGTNILILYIFIWDIFGKITKLQKSSFLKTHSNSTTS